MNTKEEEHLLSLRATVHKSKVDLRNYKPEFTRFMYPFVISLLSFFLATVTLCLMTSIMITSNINGWIATGIVGPLVIPLCIFVILGIVTICYSYSKDVRSGYEDYLGYKVNHRTALENLHFSECEYKTLDARFAELEKERSERRAQLEAERIVKEWQITEYKKGI